MLNKQFNKIFNYENYKFNIRVEINKEITSVPRGRIVNLVIVNCTDQVNYYRSYECNDEKLVDTINLAKSDIMTWVNSRKEKKSETQMILESMGFTEI